MESFLTAPRAALRILPLLPVVLAVLLSPVFGQRAPSSPHFYNIDREIKIEGIVNEIRFEPRYEKRAPFLVVLLEEKTTSRDYLVEISPAWFFDQDVHKGERMRVTGSLLVSGSGGGAGPQNVIAREIQYQGETLSVRDKNGFPNWSGGPMQHRGRRRGRKF